MRIFLGRKRKHHKPKDLFDRKIFRIRGKFFACHIKKVRREHYTHRAILFHSIFINKLIYHPFWAGKRLWHSLLFICGRIIIFIFMKEFGVVSYANGTDFSLTSWKRCESARFRVRNEATELNETWIKLVFQFCFPSFYYHNFFWVLLSTRWEIQPYASATAPLSSIIFAFFVSAKMRLGKCDAMPLEHSS